MPLSKQILLDGVNKDMKNYIMSLLCFCFCATGFCQDSGRSLDGAESRRAELLQRFPEADTNEDGLLSAREIARHMEKRRSSPEGKARLKQLLNRFPDADTNKDGELSWQELRTHQAASRENQAPRSQRNRALKVEAPVPDVAYGEHELQRFDLWPVPDAEAPTPLVIFIHGGGFRGGDKSLVQNSTIQTFHKAGIAVASMNYRLSDSGPYPIMMQDAARGLQTIRHRAAEWNIQPDQIGCFGGSAGAGISLWLAFHDDLADPSSDDPIARQSTRIVAAGAMNGQSTYDMHTFRDWFGVPDLEMDRALPAFLGVKTNDELDEPDVLRLMKDASPIHHLSEDDSASVYMTYSRPNVKVTKDSASSIWVHHVLLGLKLQEAMKARGLECVVTAPDMPAETEYESLEEFLIAKLKSTVGEK
ncbi:Carboxylesterase NlhH [Roseimaritima multifibrata]|uniref:Carboxylesterase NlhH n=1 Tax=Roseimaritima multifibrata TaxID=1930274 RepID=A0A517MMC3_9BACT|nr:alpha/beta hydrolase [Roseimaritima multifibrata]QDS96031.1 Carboxylesterase NlhH [Roseimaritima multifibrata]